MGTDVFMFVERRRPTSAAWEFVTEVDVDRNYGLFSVLGADLGYGYEPISPLRGCPEDATKESKASGLPQSWLTLRELVEHDWDGSEATAAWAYARPPVSESTFFARVLPEIVSLGSPDDVRVLFFFS